MSNGLYDFGEQIAQTYAETCACGEVIYISTQKDRTPEYYTEIHVKCNKCFKSVMFELPVN